LRACCTTHSCYLYVLVLPHRFISFPCNYRTLVIALMSSRGSLISLVRFKHTQSLQF
jgi:hypothetical protein